MAFSFARKPHGSIIARAGEKGKKKGGYWGILAKSEIPFLVAAGLSAGARAAAVFSGEKMAAGPPAGTRAPAVFSGERMPAGPPAGTRAPAIFSGERMPAGPPWGNPLIGFPHAKTFHWKLFAPLPDPGEDLWTRVTATRKGRGRRPHPPKDLVLWKPIGKAPARETPCAGKGPRRGCNRCCHQSPSRAKSPAPVFRSGASHFAASATVYSPRVVARGVVSKEGCPLLCLLSFPLSFQTKERGRRTGAKPRSSTPAFPLTDGRGDSKIL